MKTQRHVTAGRDPAKALRPGRKSELVAGVCGDWGVSIRRACRVLEMDTASFHYKSCRPDQAGLEARIKAICETRVCYGYRRVHVLLQREGWRTNIKKTHRIYNALGLQLRNKQLSYRPVKAPHNSKGCVGRCGNQSRCPKDKPCGLLVKAA